MFVSTLVLETPPGVVGYVQPVPVAEYVALARAITYAPADLVVEFTNGASPVTYAAQEASFQLPQEIVYEQLALVYEATGSQPVEYAQLSCAIDVCSPRRDARNTLTSGSLTKASALEESPQAKSSSSTPKSS